MKFLIAIFRCFATRLDRGSAKEMRLSIWVHYEKGTVPEKSSQFWHIMPVFYPPAALVIVTPFKPTKSRATQGREAMEQM